MKKQEALNKIKGGQICFKAINKDKTEIVYGIAPSMNVAIKRFPTWYVEKISENVFMANYPF